MTFIATALMGIFFLPGAATHGPLVMATSTPVTSVVAADAGEIPLSGPTLTVKLTSYNAVPAQTDGTPFETASGAYSNPEVVAARSNDLTKELPFGTIIAIERPQRQATCGYSDVEQLVGYRVIADTMNPRMHNQVDVLLNQHDTVRLGKDGAPKNPSVVLGVCRGVTIRVVGHVAIRDIPKTQHELALLVSGDATSNALALR
ncbi:MAG: hypothetical protein B7X04_03215 [Parcubacteria group bacterium 21-54-25]|nr:MAG: hypothetical protein B7X04_03215 [Parcubacteria group bacterium 21-54-25]HQU07999.1 hypothetical protein [Candidatus Paceibacterota bacterium]